MSSSGRRLVIFGMTRLDDMLRKGNVWYVTHYREGFDQVDCAYLIGSAPEKVSRGATNLWSIGRPSFIPSLLIAPWHLWRFVKTREPTHFLTADILTSWWTALPLRVFRKAKVVVMPVCTPDEIYRNSGRTFSGLPKWLEDALIWLSFWSAHSLLVAANSPATRRWLETSRFAAKVVVAKATPEEMPSIDFLDRLALCKPDERSRGVPPWKLIYVGRLEREKHVESLVHVADRLEQAGFDFVLNLAGGGTLEPDLRREIEVKGLNHRVNFLGFQKAEEVAELLAKSDVFLSTLTGTALKEAALAGLPVIAYAIDYIPDLLTDEVDSMLVAADDAEAMAAAVLRVAHEPGLRTTIADGLSRMARERWSTEAVRLGLRQAFP